MMSPDPSRTEGERQLRARDRNRRVRDLHPPRSRARDQARDAATDRDVDEAHEMGVPVSFARWYMQHSTAADRRRLLAETTDPKAQEWLRKVYRLLEPYRDRPVLVRLVAPVRVRTVARRARAREARRTRRVRVTPSGSEDSPSRPRVRAPGGAS